MQIQVNSNSSVAVDGELSQLVESTVNHALKRFEARITRVEVHLSDENDDKGGIRDKRCLMEARPAGHEPVAVTNQAASLEEALDGAVQKLKRLLDSLFGQAEDRA
jgi:ribosome-associated translation inhibitor RaiA